MRAQGETVKILLVDDQHLYRECLRITLERNERFTVVGEAESGSQAIAEARELAPDIILVGVDRPDLPGGGLGTLKCLRRELPDAKVIILTASKSNSQLFAAIGAGARGYLLKNTPSQALCAAIDEIHAGGVVVSPLMAAKLLTEFAALQAPEGNGQDVETTGSVLSPRQEEILELLQQGLSNKEIAATLWISEHTVKTHLTHIMKKLNVKNRAQAASEYADSKRADVERESLQAEIRRRTAESEATVDSIPVGVVVFDKDGRIARKNPSLRSIFGFDKKVGYVLPKSQAALPASTPRTYTAEGEMIPVEDGPSHRVLRGETIQGETLVFRRQDGENHWVLVSGAPIKGADGGINGAILTFSDITTMHQYKERFEGLLCALSNDLRTSLAVIETQWESLEQTLGLVGLSEVQQHQAKLIDAGIRHMEALIDDLVDDAT